MKHILIILSIALAIGACSKVGLYHDLSEEEANEILVALHAEGINTSKLKEVRQNEIYWTVEVEPKKIAEARKILVEHNLPRKKEAGLSGVYKEKGLIPTPDEQKARYLLALKGEIINSLTKLPDVVDADVVLNIPTPDEFAAPGAKEKRPTASVVIKARPGATGESLSEGKLQQFVANSIENLNPRDVSVIISYITPPKQGLLPGQSVIIPSVKPEAKSEAQISEPVTKIAGLELVGQSGKRLKIYLSIFFVVLSVLGAGLIVMVIRSNRMKQEMDDYRGGDTKQLVDGKIVEENPKLKSGR